jgi:hypothetical protein
MMKNKLPAAGTAGQNRATHGTVGHIYFNASGELVARLSGKTLRKRARGSIHMLRQPLAWAFDVSILEAARQDGAQVVEVVDTESRKIYQAPLVAFFLHGTHIDRGFGQQLALPLAFWRIEMPGARQLDLFEEAE